MKRIILLSIAILVIIAVATLISRRASDVTQPIDYSHQVHVEGEGMGCIDCHQTAEEGSRASIPNITFCKNCHEEAISENEAELEIVKYIGEDRPVPWKQVHTVPDHAYFSHRRHVMLGGLECVECHGDVEKQSSPFTRPYEDITMEWCIDCHEERAVTTECSACHR